MKTPLSWLLNLVNVQRLLGSRVQIIACILSRNPEPSILLAKSVYKNIWMPPQEGVNIKEHFNEALARCLKEECNININQDRKNKSKIYYVRSLHYVGKIKLPPIRQGERLVADDANHTWLERIKLRSKAYWIAIVMISDQDEIAPEANEKEILELKWFSLVQARLLIADTNEVSKANLLQKVIDKCESALIGK